MSGAAASGPAGSGDGGGSPSGGSGGGSGPRTPDPASEARLEGLREEARRRGRVEAEGVDVEGGPVPAGAPTGWRPPADGEGPGYHGLPIVKPPVWTWEVAAYLFVGGLAGMAAVVAAAVAWFGGDWALLRAAAWTAAGGSLLSALLLVADLGRPLRFLNMLRVFKWRSPMSVGAWTLTLFGGASTGTVLVVEWGLRSAAGPPQVPLLALVSAAALAGAVLATYTGVLVGATAIPAWFTHRRTLPVHFGVIALGSAACFLELAGFRTPELHALGLAAAAAETVMGLLFETWRNGAADRALREGRSGAMLRASGVLAGPGSLGLRLAGWVPAAAAVFLAGAAVSRYAWLQAGRASGVDPEATLAAQGVGSAGEGGGSP